ncbi:type I toxin-antitoxin system SymE family toxin [Tahibacter soli]|uniref:Type I toxin-antitoxin system SymE family toxin n=1 Tax=Tahibacter soli TaxID=2983605 RepID=A0A9X3YHK6_9GAMM|nr:type I toxin-antitoxin system SymE family toxin [Tahibacter soli]MDC8012427.1 type I toxin-antitoxin system SymE family toxin [Tahibacter soli]
MGKRNDKPAESSTKQIRVGTAYYSAVDYAHLPREVPNIRLRGIWLINAGFLPGDIVTIRVTAGRLVIIRA